MRSPGSAEAVFVQELLARRLPTKSFGSAPSMAQRTRYNVKSRLYERRILEDRYVPDPAALGRGLVVLAAAETFADRAKVAAGNWETLPELVHLIVAEGWQLGAFLLNSTGDVEGLRNALNPTASLRSLYLVACNVRQRSLPVYFDYEGAWAQALGVPGLRAYPRSLPSSSYTESGPSAPLNAKDRATLGALLQRPFGPSPGGDGASWLRRAAVGAREHRLLADGLVEFRSFLNPAECGRWVREFPSEMVCVAGRLVDRTVPEALFSELVGSGVLPFLFGVDAERAVFAYLTGGEAGAARREPPAAPGDGPEPPSRLIDVVVLRSQLDRTSTPVNQRFDRLDTARRATSG